MVKVIDLNIMYFFEDNNNLLDGIICVNLCNELYDKKRKNDLFNNKWVGIVNWGEVINMLYFFRCIINRMFYRMRMVWILIKFVLKRNYICKENVWFDKYIMKF